MDERHAVAASARDWGHLPAVALQALGRRCCPASRTKLRQVCRTWHDALATQFSELHVGPGSACPSGAGAQALCIERLRRSFPAAHTLHVTTSSTRDYPPSYAEDLAALLSRLPELSRLRLSELHELEDFDNLDQASLWDALEAAAPALAGRLAGLHVSHCFWNSPELLGVLRRLTALTELRLSNNPLEAAYEVATVASLSQLRVLEFGIIFDGSSQHHDVPRALESIGNLQQLQELSLPMWRRSLGGRAHPLAPALSAALGRLTRLTSLSVDGKFGHLGVVSALTNLRRLAGAAPLSAAGWEAISQLPELTLLTSLTPAAEPLRLNPARPHAGLDLATLATKGCLAGLDVALTQPEHLATLGQFTALRRLNLRCASTFQEPRQQAQVMTALSCLPGGLTGLMLGPMLPLSAELLFTLARSCPLLEALHARFMDVAPPPAAAAPGALVASSPPPVAANGDGVPGAAAAVGRAGGSGGSGGGLPMALDPADLLAAAEAGAGGELAAPGEEPRGAAGGVSGALQRLVCLTTLDLSLLAADEEDHGGTASYGGSSAGGGPPAALYRTSSGFSADKAMCGGAGAGLPSVPLVLCDLPPRLRRLALSGPWQLRLPAEPAVAAAGGGRRPCRACGRMAAAAEGAAAQQLCDCLRGLQLLTPPASPGASGASAGHKRPGSYLPGAQPASLTALRATSPIAKQQQQPAAAAAAAGQAGDVFVLEQPAGVPEKRCRSQRQAAAAGAVGGNPALPLGAAAAGSGAEAPGSAETAGPVGDQRRRLRLPELVELRLHKCQVPYPALAQLVAAAGSHLSALQLLRVQTAPATAAAAAVAAGAQPPQQPWQAGLLPALGPQGLPLGWYPPAELTTQQLRALPVAWQHLQEWDLQPHHLWGLARAGCFAAAGAPGGPAAHSAGGGGGGGGGGGLCAIGRLLNLRHLCVLNRPGSFVEPHHAAREHRPGEAVTCLPLHDAAAVGELLGELQAGLARLPALRQLVLDLGHVAGQRPDLPCACGEVWTDAGEALLAAMPACRVKHFAPAVHGDAEGAAANGGGHGVDLPMA